MLTTYNALYRWYVVEKTPYMLKKCLLYTTINSTIQLNYCAIFLFVIKDLG